MADYIYLLENRLNVAQRSALRIVREVAKARNQTIFLVGGAVRDLTSGSPVRDLDVVVQGNASKLRKDLEKSGAAILGESDASQSLYLRFAGGVRMEFGSTLSVTFPKPGKAVAKSATILEDLRRRDFTVNAMALSLNDGSYGLLMDPLNGVADIENRQLRLVSNYGFIEDPVRMIRAARLMARLGWAFDEKTQTRYETGKQEGYIAAMPEYQRGYELEEIVHEEDPLRILKRLEAEGWMKHLAPYWTAAKVNVQDLERLRDVQNQMQIQGIQPDAAAAYFPLLTAKLSAKEISSLKASFPRQGFVSDIDSLEAEAKEFGSQLSGKSAALPSQAWRLITSSSPEVVLWTAFTNKSQALQAKFKSFYTEWPQARQKMPYTLMQEMRIVPELPGYEDLLEKLFFELMDGNLTTAEEMKAFLEPYSPPAPPPPINLRRPRVSKKEAKPAKSRSKKAVREDDEGDDDVVSASDDDVDDPAIDLPEIDGDVVDAAVLDAESDDDEDEDGDDEPEDTQPQPPKKEAKKAAAESDSPQRKMIKVKVAEPAAKGIVETGGKPSSSPVPSKKTPSGSLPVAPIAVRKADVPKTSKEATQGSDRVEAKSKPGKEKTDTKPPAKVPAASGKQTPPAKAASGKTTAAKRPSARKSPVAKKA